MATHTDLDEDQKTWVLNVTRVLGTAAPHPKRRYEGILQLGEVRVAFQDHPVDAAERAHRRALILPREHGAWGLLLVPLVTGAGVGFLTSSRVVPFLLLLIAALSLFWLRTPVESLLGGAAMRARTAEERRAVGIAIAYLAAIAVLALGGLLWAGRNPALWIVGGIAATALVGQSQLRKRHARMPAEIVGTIGLTASAPAAYYVITGDFGPIAWMLWLANLIFAGDQIHYVQLRIHAAKINGLRDKLARGWAFATGQALLTAALTIACVGGLLPRFASLAFAPILFRGWFYFIQKPGPLSVRRLGWSELGHAVTFCILLIVSFAIAG
ncbi:MAG TPA: YwiC-like family protein [Verrucomicrobiae bacterium]|nr:YwiC-like family protein [Verrucomicrobiae bacterium]